ncbi:putative vitellogenin receptor [Drosophila pseudoobscura]|uniref:Vitellogenin receptor n=1 Tax=Drosophila pseudoobscura pseudoobscura TaxID=46245 RepID=A0A6I8W8C4_DROPS|nr:putative vitellogenin receptor [Drosophila pseudoobscura]
MKWDVPYDCQFSCQSGGCFDKALICDGTTCDNCENVHDEADCCKLPGDFQCAMVQTICLPRIFLRTEQDEEGAERLGQIKQKQGLKTSQ